MAKAKTRDAFTDMVESGPPGLTTDGAPGTSTSETVAVAEPPPVMPLPAVDSNSDERPSDSALTNGLSTINEQITSDEGFEIDSVLVEIPIDPLPFPSEFQIHIDLKLLPPLSTTLRRIASQLDRQLATLAGGKRVISTHDALRWILERAGEAKQIGAVGTANATTSLENL